MSNPVVVVTLVLLASLPSFILCQQETKSRQSSQKQSSTDGQSPDQSPDQPDYTLPSKGITLIYLTNITIPHGESTTGVVNILLEGDLHGKNVRIRNSRPHTFTNKQEGKLVAVWYIKSVENAATIKFTYTFKAVKEQQESSDIIITNSIRFGKHGHEFCPDTIPLTAKSGETYVFSRSNCRKPQSTTTTTTTKPPNPKQGQQEQELKQKPKIRINYRPPGK